MHQYRFRERLDHGDQARPWHLYRLTALRGSVFPCHWHPEWELLLVERGTLVLTRNQKTETMGPGEVAFLATDLHTGVSDDVDLVAHALVFHPELLRSERRDATTDLWVNPLETGSLRVTGILPAGSPPATTANELVKVIQRNPRGMELQVKGLLFRFLSEVVFEDRLEPCEPSPSADPTPPIRGVLQLIEEQFARPLTVESLAAKACLSPSQFSRLFKALTGDTPINYLIRRRIAEAARILREGQTSVTETALRVGFTNLSHFTKTFRLHQGVNPSALVRGTPSVRH